MSCSRCKKKKIVNNLDSPDHIKIAKEIYNEVILKGEPFNDLDKIEIYRAYESLYPNSSSKPSIDDAINKIKIGIEIYGTKYKR